MPWSRHLLAWLPQDGPIRAVPSSRTRRCQREAEEQRLPGWRGHGWHLGLGEVCVPPFVPGTQHLDELGCCAQMSSPEAWRDWTPTG